VFQAIPHFEQKLWYGSLDLVDWCAAHSIATPRAASGRLLVEGTPETELIWDIAEDVCRLPHNN